MTEPNSFRERAARIRQLVAGSSGAAVEAALLLAKEYEARADDLESVPAVDNFLSVAERVGSLLNRRAKQATEMIDAERVLETQLDTARRQRAIVEAQIETIVEMSCLLDIPAPKRNEAPDDLAQRRAA